MGPSGANNGKNAEGSLGLCESLFLSVGVR